MMRVDLNERFDDIEVSADLGSVRLYLTDTDYNEYNSEELLDLINEKSEKISELCIQRDYLEAENKHFREKLNHQTESVRLLSDLLKEDKTIKDVRPLVERELTEIIDEEIQHYRGQGNDVIVDYLIGFKERLFGR